MSLRASVGRRALTVCAAVFAALVVLAGPASAHAELVSSTPSRGAVVGSEPTQVTLRFSEEIVLRLSAIKVIGPDGLRLDTALPHAGPSGADSMAVDLAPDARHGTFVVVWQATAADDGHASSGTVMFAVGAASTPASVAGLGRNRLTSSVYDAGQWMGFAGLAMVGGVAALHTYRRREPEGHQDANLEKDHQDADLEKGDQDADLEGATPIWPTALGWSLLLVGTLIQLTAYAPAARGLPLTHLLDRSLLSVTLGTREGHAFMVRLAVLAVAAVVGDAVLRRATSPGWPLVFTLAVAATWGATGHAATGGGAPVAMVAVTLHVAAMAVWVGGLFVVAVSVAAKHAGAVSVAGKHAGAASVAGKHAGAASTAEGAAVTSTAEGAAVASTVRRFSRIALGAVGLLVATGVYQGWREVGSVSGLVDTTYGRLLLAKVALLFCVLIVAKGSRWIVATWHAGSERLLLRNVVAELAGASVLLVLAVLLAGNAPAR